MPELADDEIIGRVRYADGELKKFRDADLTASCAYIDANGATSGTEGGWGSGWGQEFRPALDVPEVVPVGQPNYMAINVEIGGAAVGSQVPKLHVKANDQPAVDGKPAVNIPAIIQGAWNQTWKNGGFKREMRGGWQKRNIAGLGCVWYRWDSDFGFVIENVTSNRFFFDPHARSFKRLRYGGVVVFMPMSEAIQTYDPNGENQWFDSDNWDGASTPETITAEAAERQTKERLSTGTDELFGASGERQTVKIYIYFDMQSEVHIYNEQIIHRTENLYGCVPLLFSSLFNDPRDRLLPLGMNVFARGLNQEIVWLASIASSTAKNGGPITLYDTNVINGETEVALQRGSSQQMIGIKSPLNPQRPPIHRIAGEQLPDGYGVARQEAQMAMDGIMGTTSGQRGQTPANVTATASMLAESKSNAMQIDGQTTFEEWVGDVATAWVSCVQKFGGPVEGKPTPEKSKVLWHCFVSVLEVSVVTGSTSFSNPGTELQASMQLFTTITQSWPLWMQLAAQGLTDQVPNLKMVLNDLLIAFNRSNLEEYWQNAPPPPSPQMTLPKDIAMVMQVIYQYCPPDVQREIEQAIGLQPSQMPPQPQDGEAEKPDNSGAIAALQAHMEAAKMQHETQSQQADQIHQARMAVVDTASQIAINNAKAAAEPKETPAKPAAKKKAT